MPHDMTADRSMAVTVDRGDMGAVPDPQWSERWRRWTPERVEEYLASAARWPHLSYEQAAYLIQGLPPPPPGYLPTMTCLAGVDSSCARLNQDIARGAMPRAMTPQELAAWCVNQHVDLPEAFVAGLIVSEHESRQSQSLPPTIIDSIVVPPWAPPPMPQDSVHLRARPRGRPVTRLGDYEAIVAEGRSLLMEAASGGRRLRAKEVAARLAMLPAGAGMTKENIERRLKGKLPLKAAGTLAARAQRDR